MTGHGDPVVESAERLCATLERIGDALVTLDAQTLVETEETLGRLLAALAAENVQPGHQARLEPLVRRAREALLRCRRLGASFSSVARARLQLHVGTETYGRMGEYVGPVVAGSVVKATA